MSVIKHILKNSPKTRRIVHAAATAAVLLVVLIIILIAKSRVPDYMLNVEGLSADNPAQAQAELRSEHERFAKLSAEYPDCLWVWCGGTKVYLADPHIMRIVADDKTTDFTAVRLRIEHGNKVSGYIIDPTAEPKELGRIELESAEKYSYDNVSMTVRVGLRSGEISFEDAVYLWEKGSSEVFAVKRDCYESIQRNIVRFTDDGNAEHICYILDTKI